MNLTEQDRAAIRSFAASDPPDKVLRAAAIGVFRCFLMTNPHVSPENWPVEMKFMSEVDNSCPDYILRRQFREKVLAEKIS